MEMEYKITSEDWEGKIMAQAHRGSRVFCGFGGTEDDAIADIVPRLIKNIAADTAELVDLSAQLGGMADE